VAVGTMLWPMDFFLLFECDRFRASKNSLNVLSCL
jgi:hypothetical protein